MNDAEMLSMAGKGCIMQNAHQRLKDLHPELEVIGSTPTTRYRTTCVSCSLNNLHWLFIAQLSTESSLQCLSFFLRDIHCGATHYHHYPVGLLL
jgi:hypothetical protein